MRVRKHKLKLLKRSKAYRLISELFSFSQQIGTMLVKCCCNPHTLSPKQVTNLARVCVVGGHNFASIDSLTRRLRSQVVERDKCSEL